VIIIKSFEEIYNDLKQSFYKRTKIDVEPRSVIDMVFKAVSDMLHTVYKVIEDNKKPYLFTKQTGDELDDTGYFLNCARLENESDSNYLYRLSNWVQRNAACNRTAIEDRCKELLYSVAANYVAYTHGLGTATIYLIPLDYSEESKIRALNEASEKIGAVIAPTSLVYFKIAEPSFIKLVAYIDVKDGYDYATAQNAITNSIRVYINSIAPGDSLYIGEINKIGLNVEGVEYFNIVQLFNNDEELADFELLQTIHAKFMLDQIIWWEVED
jgi:uncharacterized phage protein gp47/JayE